MDVIALWVDIEVLGKQCDEVLVVLVVVMKVVWQQRQLHRSVPGDF